MGNDIGSIKIGDDEITINIGGNSFRTSVPGVNDIGINPNDESTFHNYGDTHVLGTTRYFNGPGMLYENLTEQPAPSIFGMYNANNVILESRTGTVRIWDSTKTVRRILYLSISRY